MPVLIVSEMGFERRVNLGAGRCTIGRDQSNHLFLKNPDVSKHHCEIIRDGRAYKIVDLDSRNGILLNGEKKKESKLADGDLIRIGHATLTFIDSPSAAALGRPKDTKRLGELCAEKGLISEATLRKALEIQKETKQKLGEILIEHKLADPSQVMETLGEQMKVPWIRLANYDLNEKALSMFPRHRAAEWQAIPVIYFAETQKLVVAMTDPNNLQTIEDIEFLTYCNVEPMLASKADIQETIDRVYPAEGMEGAYKTTQKLSTASAKEAAEAEEDEGTVAKLVQSMLEEAIRLRASDIHVEPRRDRVVVRFRIDGMLHEKKVLPKELQGPVINRIKILARMDIAEKRFPQDGHYALEVDQQDIDLRIASYPTTRGEKMVLRIHNTALAIADLNVTGMPDGVKESFIKLITKPEGLLIVTGPTGSGKTTTLYGALNHVKSSHINLVTLEDPVELDVDGANQAQVGDHPRFTFASGLRAILRQDPNVILVGEVRDKETATIGIQAALTGHLVLTTLHTNSAAGAIARLVDMGVEPYLITASLLGVMSQRLVRRICPACREEFQPPDEVVRLCYENGPPPGIKFYRGKGCKQCPDGYSGRTGVFELLPITETTRRLIIRKGSPDEIRTEASRQGMVTLRDDALRRAAEGVTTLDEVVRVTYSEF